MSFNNLTNKSKCLFKKNKITTKTEEKNDNLKITHGFGEKESGGWLSGVRAWANNNYVNKRDSNLKNPGKYIPVALPLD